MSDPTVSQITLGRLESEPPRAAALLALNNVHAAELSWLDQMAFFELVRLSFVTLGIGDADAMVIALDQSAGYASPNFLWFKERYSTFVYVDRIVVAGTARGRGLARVLYQALFSAARSAGHEVVVCEVNLDPPNPASDAFSSGARLRRGWIRGHLSWRETRPLLPAHPLSEPAGAVRPRRRVFRNTGSPLTN